MKASSLDANTIILFRGEVIWVDWQDKQHRSEYRHRINELMGQLTMRNNWLPIGSTDAGLIKSLQEEYQTLEQAFQTFWTKRKDAICQYCSSISSLTMEQQFRHQEYHKLKQAWLVQRAHSMVDLERWTEHYCQRMSLPLAVQKAQAKWDVRDRQQEKEVERLFQSICPISISISFISIPLTVGKDKETYQPLPQKESKSVLSRVVHDPNDNTQCPVCATTLKTMLHEEDWTYPEGAVVGYYCGGACRPRSKSNSSLEGTGRLWFPNKVTLSCLSCKKQLDLWDRDGGYVLDWTASRVIYCQETCLHPPVMPS